MISKTKSQRIHAKRRAAQRYDLFLNRHELKGLVRRIQNQEGRFVRRESLRITVWDIDVNDKLTRVVYDSQRKTIVTFLPLEKVGDAVSQ